MCDDLQRALLVLGWHDPASALFFSGVIPSSRLGDRRRYGGLSARRTLRLTNRLRATPHDQVEPQPLFQRRCLMHVPASMKQPDPLHACASGELRSLCARISRMETESNRISASGDLAPDTVVHASHSLRCAGWCVDVCSELRH